jgi:TRAP-type C4-dicarboxylate transport system permease small subunit
MEVIRNNNLKKFWKRTENLVTSFRVSLMPRHLYVFILCILVVWICWFCLSWWSWQYSMRRIPVSTTCPV